jgi:hypothetical protein
MHLTQPNSRAKYGWRRLSRQILRDPQPWRHGASKTWWWSTTPPASAWQRSPTRRFRVRGSRASWYPCRPTRRPDGDCKRQRPISGSWRVARTTGLRSPVWAGGVGNVNGARWLPPARKELSAIANTGSSGVVGRGPHRPEDEMPIQVEDPIIIYRVASAPSRLCRREVLPPGTAASQKGR